MARITIVGAGITGMAIAASLPRQHKITIVARDLPGDVPNLDWASPWAGAMFCASECKTSREKKMQLDTLAELWRLSVQFPESSVKRVEIEDFFDSLTEADVWWKPYMHDFKFVPKDQLPPGAAIGTAYTTVTLVPQIFLPWLRKHLEASGVQFKRMSLDSLSDAPSADVVINASGVGSKILKDIQDPDVEGVRGQTMVVKTKYPKVFKFDNGTEYTYVIPRADGTSILGGVREPGKVYPEVNGDICKDIIRRISKNLPDHFSPNLADYSIVSHNVGIRPGRSSGIRVEAEVLKSGLRVVHAYGFASGGFIYSFGMARAVARLVDGFLFPAVAAKL